MHHHRATSDGWNKLCLQVAVLFTTEQAHRQLLVPHARRRAELLSLILEASLHMQSRVLGQCVTGCFLPTRAIEHQGMRIWGQ